MRTAFLAVPSGCPKVPPAVVKRWGCALPYVQFEAVILDEHRAISPKLRSATLVVCFRPIPHRVTRRLQAAGVKVIRGGQMCKALPLARVFLCNEAGGERP